MKTWYIVYSLNVATGEKTVATDFHGAPALFTKVDAARQCGIFNSTKTCKPNRFTVWHYEAYTNE